MNPNIFTDNNRKNWNYTIKKLWRRSHLDLTLLSGILILGAMGLTVLYSASNQNASLFWRQIANFAIAFVVMCVFAQIPISRYKSLAPWMFGSILFLLIFVMVSGVVSKGAQRWLNLGFWRFQPSEIMKIVMPIMLAWYLRNKTFPLYFRDLLICCIIILLPAALIAKQPDLGTSLLVSATGFFVLLLAGVSWQIIIGSFILFAIASPIVWHFLHDYQRTRVLVFLSPESDPFGSGYNIIQSKIAIGSGGWLGKGWMHSTQAHLQFLPEHSTDFIFSVFSEEFGFLGVLVLLAVFCCIVGRCLYISAYAQDTFSRLLVGSLALSFFTYVFVNIGMVAGILPVVGVPLPLISYGGSSILTIMISFGIIMSAQTHRKLISS